MDVVLYAFEVSDVVTCSLAVAAFATKCDEENVNNGEEDGEESAAAAAMVVSTSGNGDLAVISEEDR